MRLGRYLGDAVYGALDGIVTTFAVVAGVAGANLGSSIILILGAANLLADGLSMAAGNYLSKRSEEEYRKREVEEEAGLIEKDPHKAREMVEAVYAGKGFAGRQLSGIVATITSDRRRWAEEIVGREDPLHPVLSGTATFVAFVFVGTIPLASYVLALRWEFFAQYAFVLACILTAATIFLVGSLRSLVIAQRWWKAGTEMLVVGGIAALAAYGIGALLAGLA